MCPQHRNNMADINSSDQALNGLKIKTDALPNDWYVTLVNPKSGEPAENMAIARFIELLTPKQPNATLTSRGVMSPEDVFTNPSSSYLRRVIHINVMSNSKSVRLRFKKVASVVSCSIKVYGKYSTSFAGGYIEKMIGFYNSTSSNTIPSYEYAEQVVACSKKPVMSIIFQVFLLMMKALSALIL